MARLPTVNSQIGFETGRGTMPNLQRDPAIGQGLMALGAGIQDLGTVLIKRKNEIDTFRANSAYLTFQGERQQSLLDRTQNIAPGADGFTTTTVEDFNSAANAFIQTLPESLRPEFYLKLQQDRNAYVDQSSRIEFQERTRYFTTTIGEAGDQISQQVMMSPQNLATSIQQIDQLILSSSLGDVEKQEQMQIWHDKLTEAAITGQIQADPEGAYINLGGTAPAGNLALGLNPEARTAVMEAAAATGVNPNYLAMTLGTESGVGRNLPQQPVQPAGPTMTAENFHSQYYTASDFQSHDGAALAIDPNAVAALDDMTRRLGGTPLSITSAHRSAEHNESVDGATNSQHVHGTAFDIALPADPNERRRILTAAMQAGFTGFGFYADTPNMLHIDTRGTPANWFWGGGGAATPEWAEPVWDEYVAQRGAMDNATSITNPDSTATGPYQFIDATWLQLLNENAAKYGINLADMDDAAKLALRDDFRTSTLMAAEYAADNRLYMMQNLNRDVTMQETYLAHFLGPAGAVDLINQIADDPNQSAAELYPNIARANESIFFKQDGTSRTISEVYGEVVRRFDSQGMAAQPTQGQINPAYSGLSFERVAQLQGQAAAAVNDRMAAAANAATESAREQAALATANVSRVERQIYDDPTFGHADLMAEGLADADYTRLARQIDARDADTQKLSAAMERWANPNSAYSVYSEGDRNQVDMLYQAFDPGNEALLGLTTEGADGLVELVSRSGIVPESAAEQLMAMSRSGNATQMAYALTLGQRIYESNPDALYGTGVNDQLLPDILRWQDLTINQAMDYQTAANRMIADNVPMTRERMTALMPMADTFVATLDVGQIRNYFDNKYGDVMGMPNAGFTPEAEGALLTEYQSFAREAFLHEANGNPQVATALAQAHMDQLYGVTRIFGSPTIMRHPPERTYGDVGGGMEWFGQQLEYEVEAAVGMDVDRRDIVLYTYSQTERDLQAGENPRYAMGVWTMREGQRIFEWLPMAFTANKAYAENVQHQVDTRDFRTAQSNYRVDPALQQWLDANPNQFRTQLFNETRVQNAQADRTEVQQINYVPYELQARRSMALGKGMPNGGAQFPPIEVTTPPAQTLRRDGAPAADEPAFILPDVYGTNTRAPRETEPLDTGYTVHPPGTVIADLRRNPPPAAAAPGLRVAEPAQAEFGVNGVPPATVAAPAPQSDMVNDERAPSVPVPGAEQPPLNVDVEGIVAGMPQVTMQRGPIPTQTSEIVPPELEDAIETSVPPPEELPTNVEVVEATTIPIREGVDILTDMRRQDFEDVLRYVQDNNADPNVNNIDYAIRLLAERFNKTEEQVFQWLGFQYGAQADQNMPAPPAEVARAEGEGPGANVRPTDLIPENLPVPEGARILTDLTRPDIDAMLQFIDTNKPDVPNFDARRVLTRLLMTRFEQSEEQVNAVLNFILR